MWLSISTLRFPVVSLIAEETGIPISTVSRAVTSLIENGSVVEEIYSEDRRRRLLRIGPGPNNVSMDDNVRTVIDYAMSLRR